MKHLFTLMLTPLLFCISLNAQKHDYMWIMSQDRSGLVPGVDGYIMDFNEDPVDIYFLYTNMNMQRTNASICDTAGNLLFYTNGVFIANAIHEQMENGGGLNPSQLTDDFSDTGLPTEQGALFLPFPESDSLYILLHLARDYSGLVSPNTFVSQFNYSLIDQSLDNYLGAVIQKNEIVIEDTLNIGKLCAVKHANGRDWWSIIQEYNTNRFYRILINPDGIHLQEPQIIDDNMYSGAGQVVFTLDGTKFVQYTLRSLQLGHFIYIYDFDRCTGLLSNPLVINFLDDEIIAGGAAISPNSRYLYISAFRYVYQYDLWADDIAATKDTIAVYDGFLSPFSTAFYFCQLAPDGKIYINAPSGVDVMHVINNPDLPGLLCDVCQHCVQLPTYNAFSMPNFPNYRLGALQGSPCDTLRQPPTAVWSYEAEALELAFQDGSLHDIRNWHWDFGDGVTDTVPNPVHTYAAEGVYQVCLAVSNPRGVDTLCRQVQVIINSVADVEGNISASISPNPVTNGKALLKLEALVKLNNAQIIIRDALGHELLREPLQVIDGKAQQELAIGTFPAGLYFCTIEAEGDVIWQGKLVKQ